MADVQVKQPSECLRHEALNVASWPASARSPTDLRSDFGLLSHLERIVDFNAEVTHGALQFGMA